MITVEPKKRKGTKFCIIDETGGKRDGLQWFSRCFLTHVETGPDPYGKKKKSGDGSRWSLWEKTT